MSMNSVTKRPHQNLIIQYINYCGLFKSYIAQLFTALIEAARELDFNPLSDGQYDFIGGQRSFKGGGPAAPVRPMETSI